MEIIDTFLDPQKNTLDWCTFALGIAISIVIFFSYKKTHSRTLLSYVPNVWTSLGILGTFISIVYALGNIKWSAIGLNDIGALVNRIVPAFETSIIGIVGALVTSIIIKYVYAKEDAAYNEKNRLSIGDELTPEQTLHQLLVGVKSNNAALNGIVEQISEGILDKVNEVLSDKLVDIADTHAAELIKIFNREKETLSNLSNLIICSIEKTSQMTSEALQTYQQANLVRIEELEHQMISQLESTVASLSDQFVSSITEVKTKTVSAIETSMTVQSNSLIGKIGGTTDSLIAKINDLQSDLVKDSIHTHQSILDGIADQTKDAVESFKDGIDRQTKALDTLTKDYIIRIGNIAKDFEDHTGATLLMMNELLSLMKTNAGQDVSQIKEAMGELVQEGANGLLSGINSSITTLDDLTTTLSSTLNPLVGIIGASYKDYEKTFKSTERVLKKLENAETELARVLATFNTNSSEVKEIYDKLKEISDDNRALSYRISELRHAFESGGRPLPTKCPNCDAEVTNPLARYCSQCGHDLYEDI